MPTVKGEMDKRSIRERLKTEYGDFVCVNEVAEFLRIDRSTARQLINGVPYLPLGRKKLFFIGDVAERIVERKRI